MRDMTDRIREVEVDSIYHMLLHALAVCRGITYPSIVAPSVRLKKLWNKDAALRGQAACRVREFLGAQDRQLPGPNIEQCAEEYYCELFAKSRVLRVRAYLAVTEAYNVCVVPALFRSREWICPWSQWRYYVYGPMSEGEIRFVTIVASLLRTTPLEAVHRICDGDACVAGCLMDVTDAWAEIGSVDDAYDGCVCVDDIQSRYDVQERDASFAMWLRSYLCNGELRVRRRWWGYRIDSWRRSPV